MSKYVVEDEDYSRHIWRDTSQPLGEPDEDGTITYASAEPYEVEGYMAGLESQLAKREGEALKPYKQFILELEAQLETKELEVRKLVKTFSHYHEAWYDEDPNLTDACKKCGLDIRNDVHIRTPAPEPEGEEKTDGN